MKRWERAISTGSWPLLTALGLAMSWPGLATAGTNSIFTIPTATEDNVQLRGGGTAATGKSQVYVDSTPAGYSTYFTSMDTFNGHPVLGEENFALAFANWNSANSNQWTLINGGALDIDLSGVILATATTSNGGLTAIVSAQNYNRGGSGPQITQLGWVQAVMANYQPGVDGVLNPPVVTLDTFTTQHRSGTPTAIPAGPDVNNNTTPSTLPQNTSPGYADPLYPFLVKGDTNLSLGDSPSGLFPDASWRAIALLATVTLKTDGSGNVTERDLTVYNGLSYGFDLSVTPEPSAGVLFWAGIGTWLVRRQTRLRRHANSG